MVDRFWEFIAVIAFSQRTQWALLLGVVGFILFKFLSQHVLDDFELTGSMSLLAEPIKEWIDQRYGKAALTCLLSSWALAYKFYQKDKKRFYRIY
ncbi:hypothetical protein [Desulfuromonas acetoxidans]|uniref:hypothetical protein n=1 Tax=Desulfuromonas acetoxidans TaxID=891 RepID=UPI00292E510F|nr:hypothetical protein [Desulfuromonas acetoxidans]